MLFGAWQQALCSGILAVAGPVGLHIYRQRQTGAHDADHHKMMQTAVLLAFGVFDGIAQRATFFVRSSRTGAVQSQTDEAAVLESLIALGLVERGRQRQPRRLRVHALGAVGQDIIPKGGFHAQSHSRRGLDQPLQAQEAAHA